MKKIFFLLLLSSSAFAQTSTDTLDVRLKNLHYKIKDAGYYFSESEKIQSAGLLSLMMGAGCFALGEYGEDIKVKKSVLNSFGAGFTAGAFILNFVAWQKVYQAGKSLSVRTGPAGVTLAMNF